MKTQEQVTQEIANFTTQINIWASNSGNSKAYISRANYLTAGEQRQSYNMALSQLKKQVKIEIAEHKASAQIKIEVKKIYASEYTKVQLQDLAKEQGLKISGTKSQIADRING